MQILFCASRVRKKRNEMPSLLEEKPDHGICSGNNVCVHMQLACCCHLCSHHDSLLKTSLWCFFVMENRYGASLGRKVGKKINWVHLYWDITRV